MNYYFEPNGYLIIEHANIAGGGFRHFGGKVDETNREGKNKFAITINDEEIARDLSSRGWKVVVKPPRNPGDTPFMFMEVSIKYKDALNDPSAPGGKRGPVIHLVTGRKDEKLDYTTIGRLDKLSFDNAELILRPYDHNGTGQGMTAWLVNARFTQKIFDRFDVAYDDYPTE